MILDRAFLQVLSLGYMCVQADKHAIFHIWQISLPEFLQCSDLPLFSIHTGWQYFSSRIDFTPNRKSSRMFLQYVQFPLRHRLLRKDKAILLISFKWGQLFHPMNWRVSPLSYLFSFHWLCWFPHSCLSWYILSQSSNIYHQYLSTYISNHRLC